MERRKRNREAGEKSTVHLYRGQDGKLIRMVKVPGYGKKEPRALLKGIVRYN